jgi:glucose/arabinose dehydrogenase
MLKLAGLLTAVLTALVPFATLAQPVALTAELVADGFDRPVFAVSPGDERLFVVEQSGRIRIVVDGVVAQQPFLDLSAEVSGGNEQGLLGLAFHPAFAVNGRFFVNYTDRAGDTQIVGYTVAEGGATADPRSAKTLLTVDQPYANHNGGWLGFGPDGYLYVGMGDGGSGGDPQGNGQNPDVMLGKILRIDVETGAPEIFAIGVRNPWRPSFDGTDFYIADVGQNTSEEISVITTADMGANLGWNIMEGAECFQADNCNKDGLVQPVLTYSHADTGGCSITGGYVYRGAAIPEITGYYFFADFCSGRVESFRYSDGGIADHTDWTSQLGGNGAITSFGLDAAGELYYTTIEGGLFRIARAG